MVPPLEESPGLAKSWLDDMPIWKLNEHLKRKVKGDCHSSQWTRVLQWISPIGPRFFMLSLMTTSSA